MDPNEDLLKAIRASDIDRIHYLAVNGFASPHYNADAPLKLAAQKSSKRQVQDLERVLDTWPLPPESQCVAHAMLKCAKTQRHALDLGRRLALYKNRFQTAEVLCNRFDDTFEFSRTLHLVRTHMTDVLTKRFGWLRGFEQEMIRLRDYIIKLRVMTSGLVVTDGDLVSVFYKLKSHRDTSVTKEQVLRRDEFIRLFPLSKDIGEEKFKLLASAAVAESIALGYYGNTLLIPPVYELALLTQKYGIEFENNAVFF